MVRRTLLVFLGIVLLVLAVTLGYALLGLSGPEKTLDAAEAEFRAGKPAAAIRLADIAARSIGHDGPAELEARLLRLRSASYLELGNPRPALRDLARLRELRPGDRELAQEQVRWTILAGEPEQALEIAEAALAADGDAADPAMLELAGEASQAIYREEIRELLADLAKKLDPASAERAFEAIRSWLYRDPHDPVANLAIERFDGVLRESRPDVAASGVHDAKLRQIRDRIRQTLEYFARALESDGSPVAAYVGTAYALRQAGRLDDLQWLAEIHLHRFDHALSMLAAVDLAELHLSRERHAAVLELCRRELPRGHWRERLERGELDASVAGLLLAEARALEATGGRKALAALADEAEEIQADGRIDLEPSLHWIRAIAARVAGRAGDALAELGVYERALAAQTQTPEVVERRIRLMNERLELARAQNWGPQFFEYAYQTLARLDARDPRPVLEQSRFRIEQSDPEGALLRLRSARLVAAHDENVLRLRSQALDAQLERTQRGSDALLRRCLELGVDAPLDAPDELLMPVAEKALAAGRPDIALGCARLGAERFNWARWPRHLMIRAAFALGDAETARRAAETLLAYHPGDLEGLLDLRKARQLLGLRSDDVVYDLLVARQQDAITARGLLERALGRGDLLLARHLARTIEQRYRDDPQALLAVAEVYEKAGDLAGARDTLHAAGELAIQADPEMFRDAFERYVVLTARTAENPAEIELVIERFLALAGNDGPTLARLAATLHEHDLDRYAFLMLAPVLDDPAFAELRDGRLYVLGGRIAMSLGHTETARRYLLAAMLFPDGQEAGRMLALLHLDASSVAAANDCLWQDLATDASSAALLARLERGDRGLPWVRGQLAEQPADVRALALLAVLAPVDTLPAAFRSLAEEHGDALLEVLALLEVDGFERLALRRAAELVRSSERNAVARLLRSLAQLHANRASEALRDVDALIADEPLMIPAYEVALDIVDASGLEVLSGTRTIDRLLDPTILQSGLATPRLIRFATRQRASQLVARLGTRKGAAEELTALWQRQPADPATVLEQIDLLAVVGRTDLALQLCETIRRDLPDELRTRFLATYFSLVGARLAQVDDPELAERAAELAQSTIERHGPNGVAVHFLFDRDLAEHGPLGERRDAARVERLGKLLDAHLRFVRAGGDPYAGALQSTLERLAELRGRRAAIDAATERLRADPSLIHVWILRARWQAQEGEPEAAVEGLRWLHHYVPAHPAILEAVELAAREGVVGDEDVRALEAGRLDPVLLDTPDGLLAQGLVALRRADYARACELLASAATRADGAPLYYRGLSMMPLGRADDARRLLELCAERHPDSTLTTLAAGFARQLAREPQTGR